MKKIEEAQEEIYEDRFLFNGEDIHFDNDDEEEMYYSSQIKEAIKLGANWALEQFLKDLWHPTSEEPNKGKTILMEMRNGDNYALYWTNNEYSWKCICTMFTTTKWLYIDDLLPRKEAKNERA